MKSIGRVNTKYGNKICEADRACWNKLNSLRSNAPLAAVVREVGCSESIRSLHEEAKVYLGSAGSPVRLVMNIKIFQPSPNDIILNLNVILVYHIANHKLH